YTFHLRTDVWFQDHPDFAEGKGRKLIADDVVYSFNRLTDPRTASPGAWIFNDRVRQTNPFESNNDSTFILHLAVPFRALPEILTMPYCGIVPKEIVQKWGKDFSKHPCGSGPFVFKYWDRGNQLILLKNPNYWENDAKGKHLPYMAA